MAGGLGGLGGFGNVLQALGQSLLSSPSGNPFANLPQHLQAIQQQREHTASLDAMSRVAKQLGIPEEIAANPIAMSLLIQQMNTQKQSALTRQYLGQPSSLTPPGGDAAPNAVPPAPPGPAVSGSPTGGLGGFGGMPAASAVSAVSAAVPADVRGRQKALMDYATQSLGMSPVAASGFVGNFTTESRLDPNARARGDGSDGSDSIHLGQWNGKRAQNLKAFAAETGMPLSDPRTALAFAKAEATDPRYLDEGAARAWDMLRTARTPAESANIVMNHFERPSKEAAAKSINNRIGSAQSAYTLTSVGAQPADTAAADPGLNPTQPVQVAAAGKSIPVPINPPALPAQGTARPAGDNATKAWAQQNLDVSLKRIAVAEQAGLKGVVEAEKAKIPLYVKWLEPSEITRGLVSAGIDPSSEQARSLQLAAVDKRPEAVRTAEAAFPGEPRRVQQAIQAGLSDNRPEFVKLGQAAQDTPGLVRAGIEAQAQAKGAAQGAETTATAQATAAQAIPKTLANVEQSLQAIKELRTHPGLDWATGIRSAIPALPGSEARSFVTKLDQLRGQTFLSAYETLRGGGAITEVEGVKAERAIANLDRSQKKEDFLKALSDLEGVLQKGLDVVREKAGRSPANTLSATEITQSLANARAAIAEGKPRDAVLEHLRKNGIDPGGL